MTNAKTKPEPVGPTCLYKAGVAKVFEGEAVAHAENDGWKDKPSKKKG